MQVQRRPSLRPAFSSSCASAASRAPSPAHKLYPAIRRDTIAGGCAADTLPNAPSRPAHLAGEIRHRWQRRKPLLLLLLCGDTSTCTAQPCPRARGRLRMRISRPGFKGGASSLHPGRARKRRALRPLAASRAYSRETTRPLSLTSVRACGLSPACPPRCHAAHRTITACQTRVCALPPRRASLPLPTTDPSTTQSHIPSPHREPCSSPTLFDRVRSRAGLPVFRSLTLVFPAHRSPTA